MRVATWEGIRTVALSEVDDPIAGDRDVVIDVAACGICGSDVHSYVEGAWIAKGVPLGHEFSGTVRKVGTTVENIMIGDRITLNPAVYCGECDRCLDGHENLCSAMTGASGGFADRVLVRDARRDVNVFVLPPDLDFEAAAFLEPLSVAIRAVRELNPPLDEPILVMGLGSIGQCIVQVLAAFGAQTIVAVDTSRVRRDAASAGGADHTLDPRAVDVVQDLLSRYGTTSSPYRPDSGTFGAAFECSGAAPVFDQVFRLVRAAGSVSLVALTAAPITADPNVIVQKEIRVFGSFAYTTADTVAAFDLLASGAVRPQGLISHRFTLANIEEAFEAQSRSDESVKVMVHP